MTRARWALGGGLALAILATAACNRAPPPAPQLPYTTAGLGNESLTVPKRALMPRRPVSMKGVVQMVVSLPQQRLYAFKDGVLLASSPVSSGRKGHATPTGHFRILQKQVMHHSNLYSDAPMPFMQRLTEGGVALHAGVLPGYPASHGCIRLPASFARRLYGMTSFRSTVVVTRKSIGGEQDALRLAVSGTPTVLPPLTPEMLETGTNIIIVSDIAAPPPATPPTAG